MTALTAARPSEDRYLAALAHGSVFLFYFGLPITAVVWVLSRGKSRFAAVQSLQALAYQLLIAALWPLIIVPVMLLTVFILFPLTANLAASGGEMGVWPFFLLQFLIAAVMFGLVGLLMVPGMVGAIACLSGKPFNYPLIGRWIEHYVAGEPLEAAPEVE